MKNKLYQLLTDTNGATSIEYGLVLAGVSLSVIAFAFVFGDNLDVMMETFSGYLDGALGIGT